MDRRRILAALAVSSLLTACSASTPPSPAAPDADEPASLQGRVLSDARDVADQLNQRYDDMESLLP